MKFETLKDLEGWELRLRNGSERATIKVEELVRLIVEEMKRELEK